MFMGEEDGGSTYIVILQFPCKKILPIAHCQQHLLPNTPSPFSSAEAKRFLLLQLLVNFKLLYNFRCSSEQVMKVLARARAPPCSSSMSWSSIFRTTQPPEIFKLWVGLSSALSHKEPISETMGNCRLVFSEGAMWWSGGEFKLVEVEGSLRWCVSYLLAVSIFYRM